MESNQYRVENYEKAREVMMKNLDQPITHDFIKMIHARVLGIPVSEYSKNEMAVIRNDKTGEIRYMSPSRNLYPPLELITNFLDWYANSENNLLPIQIAARFHWGIVKIHPFDDGNGRVARILTCHILLKYGYTDAQCRRLEKIFADDRDGRYVQALNDSIFYEGFEHVSPTWFNYMYDCDKKIKNL